MPLPTPTFVIFDMDGTTVRHINPKLLHILEFIDDQMFKISRFFDWIFRRKAQGPMYLDIDTLENQKKPRLLAHKAMHKLRRKSVDEMVEPCPGVYSVLNLLKDHNVPMTISSNSLGKGYGYDVLKAFHLENYFLARVFREDIKKSKPNPEGFLLAIQKSGITLSKDDVVWFIGDRNKDIYAALATAEQLPCKVVPIAYALNAAVATLEKGLGPDHVIMSYHDMYVKLVTLLGQKPQKKIEESVKHAAEGH